MTEFFSILKRNDLPKLPQDYGPVLRKSWQEGNNQLEERGNKINYASAVIIFQLQCAGRI